MLFLSTFDAAETQVELYAQTGEPTHTHPTDSLIGHPAAPFVDLRRLSCQSARRTGRIRKCALLMAVITNHFCCVTICLTVSEGPGYDLH